MALVGDSFNIFYALKNVLIKRSINLACASMTVTEKQTGQVFVGVVDAVFQLPAVTSQNKGIWYTFVCGVASAGTGLSVSPAAADKILQLAKADNVDYVNSGATDVVGDSVTVASDGADGWVLLSRVGTWL